MKSGKTQTHKWQFTALGTSWSIETFSALPAKTKQLIAARIETYDKTYSRFRDDSLVAKLRTPGSYEFPNDVVPLLELYKTLYDLTDGRMTPLIGNMMEQAGYDADYSLQPKPITDLPPFAALEWDGDRTVRPTQPIVLDIGAAGKGYLVDIIATLLEDHDIYDYTIDASGDIKQKGEHTETIGLENPNDITKVIGIITLHNQSLCASAITRRAWQGLHHIFDPTTKKPTASKQATWVIAETTMLADALATALFFVPADALAAQFKFEYVALNMDGTIDSSPTLSGELFI